MKIELAQFSDLAQIQTLDRHIPTDRLTSCIDGKTVMVLRNTDGSVVGVLRWSLFWQTLPFLDLIFLAEPYRRRGYGTAMMDAWEANMQREGYADVLTSTQSDEDAWHFYEHRGYRRVGAFLPPKQEADEWIYGKSLVSETV